MNRLILLSFCFCFIFQTYSQEMKVSSGELHIHNHLNFKDLPHRTVRVWVPEDYSKKKKYSVLYMHDGQHLFDSAMTWNGEEWDVDGKMGELLKKGKIRDCIVVGIDNTEKFRGTEYFPQKIYDNTPEEYKVYLDSLTRYNGAKVMFGVVNSDRYLRFIVEKLKPFIDHHYSTKKDRANTFIMGSSRGGLISLYAICEYPEIFGAAACLSTHWPVSFDNIDNPMPKLFQDYVAKSFPDPKTHKLYFDYGTHGLDKLYEEPQLKIDSILQSKGYNDSNYKSLKFEDAFHDEDAWRARLGIPLEFILKKD